MTKATTEKKSAAEKKAAPKTEAKKARSTQKLTVTQTRLIEGQFGTFSKKGEELATKLTDIEARFDNKDSFVPQQVEASRSKLVEALALIDEAKAEFAKIGEQYRSFFG